MKHIFISAITAALALIVVLSSVTALAGEYTCSDWAREELDAALTEKVFPASLNGADMTNRITRREFAAVAVALYERIAGRAAHPSGTNPFTDTNDNYVLAAYKLGIAGGTSKTTFSPESVLTRQEAATMLARVFKQVYLNGNDNLPFNAPPSFADDSAIADWAKSCVYFMSSSDILNGVGNNKFAPKNTATREQAVIIAYRMLANISARVYDNSSKQVSIGGNTYKKIPDAFKVWQVNNAGYVYDKNLELTFKGAKANTATLLTNVAYGAEYGEITNAILDVVAFTNKTHYYLEIKPNTFAPIYDTGIIWGQTVAGGFDFKIGGTGENHDVSASVSGIELFDDYKGTE